MLENREKLTGDAVLDALKKESDKRGIFFNPNSKFKIVFDNDGTLPVFVNKKRIRETEITVYEVDIQEQDTNQIIGCPLRMFSNGTYSDWSDQTSKVRTIEGACPSDDLVRINEFLQDKKDVTFGVNHVDFTKKTASGSFVPSFRQKLILI